VKILIRKKRTIPLTILILQALLRHLPISHQKRQQISDELGRRWAGYQGEVALDYHLRSLPEKKYMILHDLNLPDGDYNCQIDTLLLSPEKALIIEVKNMSGKLIFDTENEQFIQINDGKDKGYSYPIAQAERHQKYLQNLLHDFGFPPIPVDYVVVISNPYTTYVINGRNSTNVIKRVCKADILLKKIQSFEKMYTDEILSIKELRKLSRLLVKKNTPPTNHILQKYGIQKSELLNGIHCPTCSYLPLIRDRQKWYCPSCHTFSIDAHKYALQDYFLLFNSKITNQQFRSFACITSRNTARRILHATNLKFSGTNKGRVYFPDIFPMVK
jgi:hypothetical protein